MASLSRFQSLEWRTKIGADTVATEWTAPEVLVKYYTGGACGVDKEGHPFWVETMGHADVRGTHILYVFVYMYIVVIGWPTHIKASLVTLTK